MKFKRLNAYKGRISVPQIVEGMNAAVRNSCRLSADARLLLEGNRFPSATALAILAIEEAGKVSILRGLSIAPNDEVIKASWKAYRSHIAKNAAWIIADLARNGASTLNDLRPIYDPESEHTAQLDALKQISFYTDCLGAAHWSEPHEVIDVNLAKAMVKLSELLTPKRKIEVREIELWVEHVAPHWGTQGMFNAAVNFYDAMRAEGLDFRDPNEIRRFFGIKLE